MALLGSITTLQPGLGDVQRETHSGFLGKGKVTYNLVHVVSHQLGLLATIRARQSCYIDVA